MVYLLSMRCSGCAFESALLKARADGCKGKMDLELALAFKRETFVFSIW